MIAKAPSENPLGQFKEHLAKLESVQKIGFSTLQLLDRLSDAAWSYVADHKGPRNLHKFITTSEHALEIIHTKCQLNMPASGAVAAEIPGRIIEQIEHRLEMARFELKNPPRKLDAQVGNIEMEVKPMHRRPKKEPERFINLFGEEQTEPTIPRGRRR